MIIIFSPLILNYLGSLSNIADTEIQKICVFNLILDLFDPFNTYLIMDDGYILVNHCLRQNLGQNGVFIDSTFSTQYSLN